MENEKELQEEKVNSSAEETLENEEHAHLDEAGYFEDACDDFCEDECNECSCNEEHNESCDCKEPKCKPCKTGKKVIVGAAIGAVLTATAVAIYKIFKN